MKNKTFGNITNESTISNDDKINYNRFRNNGIEFLSPDDRQSARDINRPVRQLYEDVENNYELLQAISKIVIGDKKVGIIPDMLEEFNVNNLIIGNYYHRNEPFLRIPTGAFIINHNFERAEDETENIYNLKPKFLSSEGKDFNIDGYVKRDRNSLFVVNKPQIELFERELGNHYNIDLAEQDNDISVDYTVEDNSLIYNCYVTRNLISDSLIITKKFEVSLGNSKLNNVFDITNAFYSTVTQYANTDGYYSLEETIPLKNVSDGTYILFFRIDNYTDKTTYSLSGNYGITLKNNELQKNNVPLFEFTLTNGAFSNKKCLIEKINRSALDIKNLNISNNYITVDETAWHLCTDSQIKDMI